MLSLLERKPPTRSIRRTVTPTGRERRFRNQDFILSKTDLKGRITYANDVFLAISGFTEREVMGAPHSIVRHPEMPRCVFQFFWETIKSGNEIFAYVVNLCKNGDHYWVLAHVTPTFDAAGQIVGYHSNRRSPDRRAVAEIKEVYANLLAIENRHQDRKEGLAASRSALDKMLADKGLSFNEFTLSL